MPASTGTLCRRLCHQAKLAHLHRPREEVEARVQRALAYTPPPGAASLEVHNDGALGDAGQRLLNALENLPDWPRRSGKLSPIAPMLSSTP